MNCPNCESQTKKDGKDRNGNQRLKCLACGKRFSEPKDKSLGVMRLPEEKALMCLRLLVEGNSIRSTERITDVHRDTIISLLKVVGEKCLAIQENLVKNVKVADVQADEIWAYVGMKQKTANRQGLDEKDQVGNAYTFTAIESDSKLIVAWHLGKRTEQDALVFLEKLYAATEPTKRFQMSTDGFRGYDHTVNEVLGTKADYGQVIKIYGKPNPDEIRYSAADCLGVKKRVICGNPDKDRISTSYVERQNLTMRMSMRRLTRLTNGFSKKWENLNYALALYFAYYNFCRIHKTLRVTPAMAAGISKRVWELKDLLK
ncbi:MAG: IS1 family transposase [Acidobacteria bacterium]|jgi:transposase-like protein/IS1 family transposase|nr:IS1 family transposase [Acidobacteriota bacterium]